MSWQYTQRMNAHYLFDRDLDKKIFFSVIRQRGSIDAHVHTQSGEKLFASMHIHTISFPTCFFPQLI